VDDDADPQLTFRPAGVREAGVVVGQETVEGRDDAVQQERLGNLVYRMDRAISRSLPGVMRLRLAVARHGGPMRGGTGHCSLN
jgi:hypothetical protein